MIYRRKYDRLIESIVSAYDNENLTTPESMIGGNGIGKKVVAIITSDPDQNIDWSSEYQPFGATELTDDDYQEIADDCGTCNADETCNFSDESSCKEILTQILDELVSLRGGDDEKEEVDETDEEEDGEDPTCADCQLPDVQEKENAQVEEGEEDEEGDIEFSLTDKLIESFIGQDDDETYDNVFYAVQALLKKHNDAPVDYRDQMRWCEKHYEEVEKLVEEYRSY